MPLAIAHLGPAGTNTETAAIAHATWLTESTGQAVELAPYSSIVGTLQAVAQGETQLAVVPVENSIEGSVTITLDTLWQLGQLQIQQALILPILHVLVSHASSLAELQTVYSHPQALAQCQGWLEKFVPYVQLIPTSSTTEPLPYLQQDPTRAAITSQRAAQLYQSPILAGPINDCSGNCTRFWVLSLDPSPGGSHTSLAFSVRENVPGALVRPLQIFASRKINLSRIESRPTKRSLGDYLFFMDLEADSRQLETQTALQELANYTETLKIFGSYPVTPVLPADIS